MNDSKESPGSGPEPGERIPYHAGYLAAVVILAALNAVFFVYVAGELEDPNVKFNAKGLIGIFFGILYAGGCSLTASGLTRWLRRRSPADRILALVFINLAGLTLLVLAAPALAEFFWRKGG